MKIANSWTTYRTRFLIQAKQLTTILSFTDALGRQHSGSRGDYLVETSDGVLRIAPRKIFEDIYVPLSDTADDWSRQRPQPRKPSVLLPAPGLTRKSPQPYRDRRPDPGVRFL